MRKEKNGLRIGQRIKYLRIVQDKEGRRRAHAQKGTITDLYEHIFRVKWDDHDWLECFPYGVLHCVVGERIEPM